MGKFNVMMSYPLRQLRYAPKPFDDSVSEQFHGPQTLELSGGRSLRFYNIELKS